jgi:hypothetical protein
MLRSWWQVYTYCHRNQDQGFWDQTNLCPRKQWSLDERCTFKVDANRGQKLRHRQKNVQDGDQCKLARCWNGGVRATRPSSGHQKHLQWSFLQTTVLGKDARHVHLHRQVRHQDQLVKNQRVPVWLGKNLCKKEQRWVLCHLHAQCFVWKPKYSSCATA